MKDKDTNTKSDMKDDKELYNALLTTAMWYLTVLRQPIPFEIKTKLRELDKNGAKIKIEIH